MLFSAPVLLQFMMTATVMMLSVSATGGPLTDPCYNYTALDQTWRASNNTQIQNMCDRNYDWVGWYRFFYNGMNIQLAERCIDKWTACGTAAKLWLNGSHPQIQDGVVTLPVCAEWTSNCCEYTSGPVRVKACPGGYYVYEITKPTSCNRAFCTDIDTITPALPPVTPETLTTTTPPTADLCAELTCTEDEWCGEKNGVYGCYCDETYDETDSEPYDAVLSCHSSSGTISLSRCQLLEAGFPAHVLHMNDLSCTGTIRDGRVIFQFDNNMRICGTTLTTNSTHFMYENSVQGLVDWSRFPISRERQLNLRFECAYPIIQTVSMKEDIIPLERNVNVELPAGQGTYQVQMIPYSDPEFSHPFNGSVDEIVDERLYVAVHVDGVDSSHVAMVMDTCWATPLSDPAYNISWDLIVNRCPNPEDRTVEVLENGDSTTGLFSFRIFTFMGNFSQVFLHCKTHICLLKDNSCTLPCDQAYHLRRRRSVDGHDSASVSLGPLEFSDRNKDAVDVQFPTAVRIHRAP